MILKEELERERILTQQVYYIPGIYLLCVQCTMYTYCTVYTVCTPPNDTHHSMMIILISHTD